MWWIFLAMVFLLLLICLMPVGLIVKYDTSGFKLLVKVAFLRFSLLKDRKKKRNNQEESETVSQKENKSNEKGGNLSDFLPIARSVIDLLSELRRRIVVRNFQLKLTLAGSDPCDLSVNYGRTWAALGALQPQLNRFLRIRKQKVDVQCDYLAEHTTVFCYVDISISVIRLLLLIATHGTKVLDEYNNLKNKRKGGTVYESETSSDA